LWSTIGEEWVWIANCLRLCLTGGIGVVHGGMGRCLIDCRQMHEHGKRKRQDQKPERLPPQHVYASDHPPTFANSSRDAIVVPE
jgi:hypothetical protein